MNLETYQKLRSQADTFRRRADESAGVIKQLTKRLSDEFDCENVKDGHRVLEKLKRELSQAEREFDKELQAFESEWGEKLEGE